MVKYITQSNAKLTKHIDIHTYTHTPLLHDFGHEKGDCSDERRSYVYNSI